MGGEREECGEGLEGGKEGGRMVRWVTVADGFNVDFEGGDGGDGVEMGEMVEIGDGGDGGMV